MTPTSPTPRRRLAGRLLGAGGAAAAAAAAITLSAVLPAFADQGPPPAPESAGQPAASARIAFVDWCGRGAIGEIGTAGSGAAFRGDAEWSDDPEGVAAGRHFAADPADAYSSVVREGARLTAAAGITDVRFTPECRSAAGASPAVPVAEAFGRDALLVLDSAASTAWWSATSGPQAQITVNGLKILGQPADVSDGDYTNTFTADSGEGAITVAVSAQRRVSEPSGTLLPQAAPRPPATSRPQVTPGQATTGQPTPGQPTTPGPSATSRPPASPQAQATPGPPATSRPHAESTAARAAAWLSVRFEVARVDAEGKPISGFDYAIEFVGAAVHVPVDGTAGGEATPRDDRSPSEPGATPADPGDSTAGSIGGGPGDPAGSGGGPTQGAAAPSDRPTGTEADQNGAWSADPPATPPAETPDDDGQGPADEAPTQSDPAPGPTVAAPTDPEHAPSVEPGGGADPAGAPDDGRLPVAGSALVGLVVTGLAALGGGGTAIYLGRGRKSGFDGDGIGDSRPRSSRSADDWL
ncbi:hypothetical protein [Streptomonospora litoralis]|uniref:Uncharacterized protein n=1 Tax=Streptomonospora litoralis TaxID=2498135 RepID=A0A4P6Q3Q3_9ACTN|nr:hypothetical protein [Streptomonospora litoralis]QBI55318.1 hypothetical protein EKD16_17750 [Streptomonospora litoralis]